MKYCISQYELNKTIKESWEERNRNEWAFVKFVSECNIGAKYLSSVLGTSMEWSTLWRKVALLRDLDDWGINYAEYSKVSMADIIYVYRYLNKDIARKFIDNYYVHDRFALFRSVVQEGYEFWHKERKQYYERSEARRRFLRAYSSLSPTKGAE